KIDSVIVKDLSGKYGIDLLMASIFSRRGITEPEDIKFYLESDLRYTHNPFLFEEMEDAVDRIRQAAEEGEKVKIFGDRDVDGITSTVILKNGLVSIGIDAAWSLPEGNDPYGLTIEGIDKFAAEDGTLIITVDCGITNNKEIEYAREKGIDSIIIDHHLPSETIPPAVAIINPKSNDSCYPFRDLAACGVVSKVVWALSFSTNELYKAEIVLLNIRPGNDTFIIDAVRLINMVEIERVSENIVPGVVRVEQTRLGEFLYNRQILVYDEEMQKVMLKKVFDKDTEFELMDIAPQIWEVFPKLKGMSLIEMRGKSKSARYLGNSIAEIDVFLNLLNAYIYKKIDLMKSNFENNLDLVALGTLADMMPLKDENRILLKHGMKLINNSKRSGLNELLFKQNLLGKKISTTDLGWQITPVINASGRLGQPGKAAELFISEDPGVQKNMAEEIVQMNKERKKLGESAWKSVLPKAEKSFKELDEKMIFVVDKKIHRGITGIIASRLANTFGVPAAVVAYLENHLVGSMRSARKVNVKEFLSRFEKYFIDYGGHDYAAGFSFAEDKLNNLQRDFTHEAKKLSFPELSEESLEIDAELPLKYMTPDIISIVETFEPYGQGNPPLIFLLRSVTLQNMEIVGKTEQQHVKMLVNTGAIKWPAIYWRAAEKVNVEFTTNEKVDVVFRLGRNYFQNIEKLQLTVMDIKRSEV
ncbi:MAG: single-stranded-DNA-specific exonuclease RecJ, partial [Spirochaetaceae bacterium]|nr:single-stranded-DNA-specific exonuclease RecJ [Spirochaetaceae bacterium]